MKAMLGTKPCEKRQALFVIELLDVGRQEQLIPRAGEVTSLQAPSTRGLG
jgi:hypothetical protein